MSTKDKEKLGQLIDKIKEHDLRAVKQCLQEGVDVNKAESSILPLNLAVEKQQEAIVKALLDANANPNIAMQQPCTCHCEEVIPLHSCASIVEEEQKIAKLLLAAKADVNLRDSNGQTPLHKSALHGNLPLTKLLLKNGANVHAVNLSDETPLHEACHDSHMEIIKLMLSHGANINSCEKSVLSPLTMAVIRNKSQFVQFLLDNGALPDYTPDKANMTALLSACRMSGIEVVKTLVAGGANPKVINSAGETCFHQAVQNKLGDLEIIKYLGNLGVDMYAKNLLNQSPFHMAQICGRADSLVALLGIGFDIRREEDPEEPGKYVLETARMPLSEHDEGFVHHQKILTFLQVLLAAGSPVPYSLPVASDADFKYLKDSMNNVKDTSTLNEMKIIDALLDQYVHSPQSLKDICRLRVRQRCGEFEKDISERIDSLPLPDAMKEFVKFENFIKRENKDRCLGCNEYMDECECPDYDDYYEDYEDYEDYDDDDDYDDQEHV